MTFFTDGVEVVRLRRTPIRDPYNPNRLTPGSWSAAVDELVIPGAYVASSSSQLVPDAARTQTITTRSVYCPAGSDVQVGDRIRYEGRTYETTGNFLEDRNPFTGWRPLREIGVKEVSG